MKTYINSTQLSFVMGIKKEAARAMMCHAWCKSKGIKNTAAKTAKGKLIDDYPEAMEIAMLEKELNMPHLGMAVNDIYDNYLKRPASRKWILCDYPEKEIAKMAESGKLKRLNVPTALRSLLPDAVVEEIKEQWRRRYPKQFKDA